MVPSELAEELEDCLIALVDVFLSFLLHAFDFQSGISNCDVCVSLALGPLEQLSMTLEDLA